MEKAQHQNLDQEFSVSLQPVAIQLLHSHNLDQNNPCYLVIKDSRIRVTVTIFYVMFVF
ncbi:hypothetical protein HanIR_Chr11g0532991 [Helianthus annuus]|nr:hypothetical protein HanIR_Chr11g0532991 [Helianthus annuus]